jgi:hypothetical protein
MLVTRILTFSARPLAALLTAYSAAAVPIAKVTVNIA